MRLKLPSYKRPYQPINVLGGGVNQVPYSGCVTLTRRSLGVLEYVAKNPSLVVCDDLTEDEIVDGLQRALKLVLDRASENDTASSVAYMNELALLQWQEPLDQ